MWPNSSLQNYSLASNSYEKVGLDIWDFNKRMDSNNGLKLQTNQSTIEKENCFHIFIIILTLRMIIHILDMPLPRGVVYPGDFLKKSIYIYLCRLRVAVKSTS